MNEICKIVPSQKENHKINVRGYLMVQDKVRESTYYWCCDKRKLEHCRG
jgi:hypothetical protein